MKLSRVQILQERQLEQETLLIYASPTLKEQFAGATPANVFGAKFNRYWEEHSRPVYLIHLSEVITDFLEWWEKNYPKSLPSGLELGDLKIYITYRIWEQKLAGNRIFEASLRPYVNTLYLAKQSQQTFYKSWNRALARFPEFKELISQMQLGPILDEFAKNHLEQVEQLVTKVSQIFTEEPNHLLEEGND